MDGPLKPLDDVSAGVQIDGNDIVLRRYGTLAAVVGGRA